VVPETAAMSEAEWQEFYAVIDRALARRPARIRRQLNLFIRIINLQSLLRYRAPLPRLSNQQRHALLSRIEDSPLLLFRRGLWAIRTLVFMGYYARKECSSALGYAASARGWELRR
jgi:hypothetical protein